MKSNDEWVLFKAEASGMKRPLYAVEIAAQRMRGYAPEGTRFRVLLNHGIPMGPEAQALHGYTEDYLREHGQEPGLAHSLFREYVGSCPVVSYNLPMNWDRLLLPECQRLGVPLPGVRGFCALTLARRVLPEAASYSLSALNKRYRLVQGDPAGDRPRGQGDARRPGAPREGASVLPGNRPGTPAAGRGRCEVRDRCANPLAMKRIRQNRLSLAVWLIPLAVGALSALMSPQLSNHPTA